MMSDGTLALRRCRKTQAEIARLLDVSKQSVSRWWSGAKVPGPEHRARLEALGLVKAEQWEQDKASGRKAAPRATVPAQDPPGRLDTRAKLEAQVRRLEALLGAELSASASVQVERALGQALGAIAKLDGTQITEPVLVRHPAHQRVMAVVFSALESYPDAARSVADALRAVAG